MKKSILHELDNLIGEAMADAAWWEKGDGVMDNELDEGVYKSKYNRNSDLTEFEKISDELMKQYGEEKILKAISFLHKINDKAQENVDYSDYEKKEPMLNIIPILQQKFSFSKQDAIEVFKLWLEDPETYVRNYKINEESWEPDARKDAEENTPPEYAPSSDWPERKEMTGNFRCASCKEPCNAIDLGDDEVQSSCCPSGAIRLPDGENTYSKKDLEPYLDECMIGEAIDNSQPALSNYNQVKIKIKQDSEYYTQFSEDDSEDDSEETIDFPIGDELFVQKIDEDEDAIRFETSDGIQFWIPNDDFEYVQGSHQSNDLYGSGGTTVGEAKIPAQPAGFEWVDDEDTTEPEKDKTIIGKEKKPIEYKPLKGIKEAKMNAQKKILPKKETKDLTIEWDTSYSKTLKLIYAAEKFGGKEVDESQDGEFGLHTSYMEFQDEEKANKFIAMLKSAMKKFGEDELGPIYIDQEELLGEQRKMKQLKGIKEAFGMQRDDVYGGGEFRCKFLNDATYDTIDGNQQEEFEVQAGEIKNIVIMDSENYGTNFLDFILDDGTTVVGVPVEDVELTRIDDNLGEQRKMKTNKNNSLDALINEGVKQTVTRSRGIKTKQNSRLIKEGNVTNSRGYDIEFPDITPGQKLELSEDADILATYLELEDTSKVKSIGEAFKVGRRKFRVVNDNPGLFNELYAADDKWELQAGQDHVYIFEAVTSDEEKAENKKEEEKEMREDKKKQDADKKMKEESASLGEAAGDWSPGSDGYKWLDDVSQDDVDDIIKHRREDDDDDWDGEMTTSRMGNIAVEPHMNECDMVTEADDSSENDDPTDEHPWKGIAKYELDTIKGLGSSAVDGIKKLKHPIKSFKNLLNVVDESAARKKLSEGGAFTGDTVSDDAPLGEEDDEDYTSGSDFEISMADGHLTISKGDCEIELDEQEVQALMDYVNKF